MLVRWLADQDAELLISVLTLGEIVKGIELMARGNAKPTTCHACHPPDAAIDDSGASRSLFPDRVVR